MVGSTGDITDLKRVEEALRESEERYALAMRAAVEGIYEWNVETGTLFLSDQAKAFFALPAERLAPKDWNARVHPEDLEAYQRATVNHFKGRTPHLELEYRIRDAAGGYRWVLDRGIAVRSAKGRVTRLVGALSDITQRKRAEIELRRARDEATAALAEQTALREVLEAISRSAFDLDAVLRTLIEHATRLARAEKGFIFRLEGDVYRLAVDFGAPPEFREFIERNPIRADSGGVVGLTARAGRTVHIEDATTDPRFRWQESQRLGGFRTVIGVPMLREGVVIGVIALWKERVEHFTQAQIDLVTTFSNQALIAIENARLFKETKEALEHQTATAEILRVISSSPTDLQPVFEAIVESATRLCESADASLYRAEGDVMRHVASHGVASTLGIGETRPITRGSVSGRSMIDRRPIHVPDLAATSAEYPEISPVVFRRVRTTLGVPLLREGVALGSIVIRRLEVRPCSDRQIALLRTFADQAVIAIENVRLFNETKEALEQQTATAQILRVISESPGDLDPVFRVILERATGLCEAQIGHLFRYDGERYHVTATRGGEAAAIARWKEAFSGVVRPGSHSALARLLVEKKPIHIPDVLEDVAYREGDVMRLQTVNVLKARTFLAVPLLKDDVIIGAVVIYRLEVRPFTDRQIALVRTFADQAVIAIENVRLFNETKEALERQTATAEILKVISSSPTDVQPVFDAIITSASRLAGGCSVNLSRVVGDELHLVAYTAIDPAKDEILGNAFPVHLSEARPIAEAVRRRSPFVVSDHETDPLGSAKSRAVMRARGFRSTLYVPIVHGDAALGVMHVSKIEPGPFPQQSIDLLTTFADQAAIAIENVRLFNETKEALDQQRASAEVLSAISSSIADARPVFDKILERCQGLFGGRLVGINLVGDDGLLGLAAYHGPGREELERVFPLRVDRDSGSGRSIVDRCVIHYPDAQQGADVPDATRRGCAATGIKSVIFAPMLWEGRGIGVIFLGREHLGSFSEKEIALLRTFADQAVIAIQNARLFNETKEALEQQTATAEILKVISSSRTDIKPVFDVVAHNAARLCGAPDAFIAMADGEVLRLATSVGPFAKTFGPDLAIPIARGSVSGRAVLDRTTIHVVDLAAESEDEYPVGKKFQRVYGHRTVIATPLLRGDTALGVINVLRQEVRPFTDRQVALLKTFADQAVIAIENVRLFNETKEALERQTATADILRVISSSLTDLAPVFDAILENAIRLCDGDTAALWRYDGHVLRFAAGNNISPEVEALMRQHPLELGEYNPTPQAALERRAVHVLDVFGAPDYRPLIPAGTLPHRPSAPTVLAVPLLREGELLGVISVWRLEKRLFTDKQVEMVNTFAAQAVIAIENVRLFNETKEALDQQKASAEVLQVISSSVADTTPVFDKILESCERLFVGQHVGINLIGEDGAVHLGPYRGPRRPEVERVFPLPLSRESATGLAILERRVMHYPDMEHAADVPEPVRRTAKMTGFKSVIFAPMLWEGRGIGAIWVNREFAGPFSDKEITLLKTFADQAVIAIQNSRLFNETKEALDQQKASAEVLQVIGSSVADTKPVFDKILESSERLFQGRNVGICVVGDDGAIHLSAYHGPNPEEMMRHFPVPLSEASANGTAILQRRVIHYPDTQAEGVPDYARRGGHIGGNRSALFAPMLWEGRGIGSIFVGRATVGGFSEKEIALLKTFADQAVIAIQNARLFHEIQEKSHQLEIADQHKSAFLANMSHELRTPLNAVIGFSEMLAARYFGELTAKQAEYVNDIHGSGKHLLSLINDILDLSKIEAGRTELELAEFDLPAALDNALTLVRERAQRGGVALHLETDPQLRAFTGDERKLKQVVLNLLSNAVKFTPSGGSVSVVAKQVDGNAEIAVRDTGVGMAPADHGAIFEAFRQVGTDVTRKREGTGLGLALARRFVELHGGTIRVDSAPGKGSTFTVTLPIRHGE